MVQTSSSFSSVLISSRKSYSTTRPRLSTNLWCWRHPAHWWNALGVGDNQHKRFPYYSKSIEWSPPNSFKLKHINGTSTITTTTIINTKSLVLKITAFHTRKTYNNGHTLICSRVTFMFIVPYNNQPLFLSQKTFIIFKHLGLMSYTNSAPEAPYSTKINMPTSNNKKKES